jgi:hypothetical protein
MRIIVVHFASRRPEAVEKAAKEAARGFEAQGHQVTLLNAMNDTDSRLTAAEFIVVVSESAGALGTKMPAKLDEYLASSGRAEGKRSMAVLVKGIAFAEKSSLKLMTLMEKHGLVVIDSIAVGSGQDLFGLFKSYRAER